MDDILFWFMSGSDWFALICAVGLGFGAGFLAPQGWWSVYVSILVSYHLFLAWLLLTAKKPVETMRPLVYSAAIHICCLVVILAAGAGRLFVPHFDLLCCAVAVFAFFERDWLFQPTADGVPDAEDTVASSAEEYQEWLRHLAKEGSRASESTESRKDEFEKWLRIRRSRGATASEDN